MTKRMLIDATHPEETRVAVVDGTRLEEFDFEMAARRQIKSNIYLAKVTRVEPSLQAAFVEYGGNRHGFLPFPEIHPDYYRIPVSDRSAHEYEPPRSRQERHHDAPEALHHEEPADSDAPFESHAADETPLQPEEQPEPESDEPWAPPEEAIPAAAEPDPVISEAIAVGAFAEIVPEAEPTETSVDDSGRPDAEPFEERAESVEDAVELVENDAEPTAELGEIETGAAEAGEPEPHDAGTEPETNGHDTDPGNGEAARVDATEAVDVVGGDEVEDAQRRRRAQMPHYKIQEVIKRRQIMLVQVSKEERGNKGAAVTTYLSLPGRYCVLMPNTSRGGGVSRKIANPADRKRMKELISDLEVPEGMSVILRTAGVERTKAEIKRDLEYLLRLWENIRTLTLESTAPALIYEEGNLVKRAIRDLYSRDIESIEIAGEDAYRQAKDFMRMLMPSHAKRVQPYRDPSIPLFFRYQVESQIDLMHNPVAHLRSGGYIVINQTEALVAIDVNSGRSTRERNIEETALKTNLEAADEIARQLRLRDMGGLIVIDFIDMDEPRHDAQVERRLKEAMKNDRARIQVGRISPFGLLELSRQRLHPSLIETNFHTCAHCMGTGLVRSTESAALMVLRAIEEEGIKRRSAELAVTVAGEIALYILNQKRGALTEIEQRYGFSVRILADDKLIAPEHRIERVRLKPPGAELPPILSQTSIMTTTPEIEEEDEEEEPEEVKASDGEGGESAAEGERRRKRRRNRRRRGGRDARHEEGHHEEGQHDEGGHQNGVQEAHGEDWAAPVETGAGGAAAEELEDEESEAAERSYDAEPAEGDAAVEGETAAEGSRRRRRGRRGGRGRPRRNGEDRQHGLPSGAEAAHEFHFQGDDPAANIAIEPKPERIEASEFTAESFAEAEPVAEAEPAHQVESAANDEPVKEREQVAEPIPAAAESAPEVPEPPPPPQPVAREYEVINQPPAQPRRGFWKRFVE